MNVPRLCGHVLLWVGFLDGALVTVRSTEVPGDPWATIAWFEYAVALAVAVAGVIILRTTKRSARAGAEKQAGNVAEMKAVLMRLRKRLEFWQTDAGKMPVHDVHRAIDEHLTDDFALFADLRESLIDAFGLSGFAAVMTEFALAERTVNRIWSASADGYIDEVAACLPRAVAHLDHAIQRLDTALAAARPADG
jgi:hypothetical protein